MYLKELTLRGFKSFASATTLRFEPGITAVVGPNGSGKSNVVDALAWVMGEQGAKTLRGSSMEDVIFAGTSSRPPLGRAQVSLTIDNTDHALNIDYSEVTISRTIFRSGGSEYSINGTPVRLLDVQELLSDTGLGAQMHVIVGQGRLSTILHADPAGHRALIEEAAGILKHRKRKERSLRKLKSTQDNLARLDDLLTEINRQLGPLRRQASVSRHADGIQVSLRDAKARLLADDAAQLETVRNSNRESLTKVRQHLSVQQRELARTKLRIEQLEEESSATNPAITALSDSVHRFQQIDERYQSLIRLIEERRRSISSQNEAKPYSDPDILEKRAQELDAQIGEQSTVAQNTNVAQERATQERADKESKLAGLRQTIGELRRSTKEREGNVARLSQLIARQDSVLESSDKRRKDFETQRAELEGQIKQLSAEIDTSQNGMESDTESVNAHIDEVEEQLNRAKDELGTIRDHRQEVENTKIRLDARADALKDTVEQRQNRTSLSKNEELHRLGNLASFLSVEEGWEEALAKALSQFSSAIVVAEQSDMDTALSLAEKNKAEQTALLSPLEESPNDFGARLTGEEHGVIPASSVVGAAKASDTTSDGIVAAVRSLLDGVGLTHTWQQARTAMAAGGWRLIVAQSGEIITAAGVVTASTSAPSDLSLLARRQKALKESKELENQLTQAEKNLTEISATVEKLTHELTELKADRAEHRIALQQAATAIEMRKKQIEEHQHRLASIDTSLASIDGEKTAAVNKKSELETALKQASESGEESFSLEDFENREARLEKDLTAARETEVEAKLAAGEANRKLDSLTRQSKLLHDEAAHALSQRKAAQERTQRRERQLTDLKNLDASVISVRTLLAACIQQAKIRRAEAQKQASAHDEELGVLREQRNAVEPQVAELTTAEHELDVARERYATQFGQLQQKITDELSMDIGTLVNQYGPEQPVPLLDEKGDPIPQEATDEENSNEENTALTEKDISVDSEEGLSSSAAPRSGFVGATITYKTVPYVRAEQEKRLKKAEADLNKLGKVNPLATEEYDALQERHSYLNEQRNDVSASRDNLLQIVKDLDATMQRVFQEAFDDVSAAFEKIFAILFPGGKGRLRLENENELLTTGVLVEASPAGKRVKQLTLLSGGEKSLTSLALLLAIFTARPSPFYVMDEVEAALDDINLSRLLKALKQLREHAQLIIITHQQRTMSIADALYGITMRSDGVTAVVSQKMEKRS